MNKMKMLVAIILFGSLWGFSEIFIGSMLSDMGLPSGSIMTGIFAMFFLISSRLLYKQHGMQLGMGAVAGCLRIFNPFMGCQICSAIAIMAEAAIFELLFSNILFNLSELKTNTMKISAGIVSSYVLFVSGYIITQTLTPVVAGSGFYLENLITFMPRILSAGLIAAIIGGICLPLVVLVSNIDLKIKDKIYYPTALGLSAICWLIVISIWFIGA